MAAFPTNLQTRITQNSDRVLNQRVIVAEYGDGASQAAAVGINSRYDEWNVELAYLDSTLRSSFMTFFNEVGLYQQFDWTPPGSSAGKYRITEPPVETNQGIYTTITFKCKQVY